MAATTVLLSEELTKGLECYRVELHIHLDGCISADLLWKIAQRRSDVLPERYMESREEFDKYVTCQGSSINLKEMLRTMFNYIPLLIDDAEVLEAMCEEFVQRQVASKIFYSEVRFCPHLLCNSKLNPDSVTRIVLTALDKLAQKYGIIVKAILCCMRHWKGDKRGYEIIELALKYRGLGVVGIDLAGNEDDATGVDWTAVFKEAKEKGVNITIHAGEGCGPESVTDALDNLYAQRIGHGYHCLDDPLVSARVNRERVHLECCVSSSIITGSIKGIELPHFSRDTCVACAVHDLKGSTLDIIEEDTKSEGDDREAWKSHPIQTFIKEGFNFGINTDDPSVMKISYENELDVCEKYLGMSKQQIAQCWINMIDACFVSNVAEKKSIRDTVKKRIKQFWLTDFEC